MKAKGFSGPLLPGGVDEYILRSPEPMRSRLEEMRGAIRSAAPGAIETVSYFDMPGYAYEGYDYHGMFAWFSVKGAQVRLHVRPPVLENHSKELAGHAASKAIVSFPADEAIPRALVKKLVKASVGLMKKGRPV